ncbi:hypothetical protein CTAYLR_010137 [Chrysophaeum taylorii]|uniref:Uncharacterized protein n=1 Tax=Chrysophaeum taylorii TaxID=2483200 RepID=A0AAD7XMR0_9STRA|nr:hypothetical protein CTAYLR_010137 [Chrysophaeum taylorii]
MDSSSLNLDYSNYLPSADALPESLKKLSLAANGLTEIRLDHLLKLEEVDLGYNKLTSAVSVPATLTSLNLEYNKVSVAALDLPGSLVSLNLRHNGLGPSGARLLAPKLSGLSKLKFLDLAYNNLGKQGLRALLVVLPSLPSLEILSLDDDDDVHRAREDHLVDDAASACLFC